MIFHALDSNPVATVLNLVGGPRALRHNSCVLLQPMLFHWPTGQRPGKPKLSRPARAACPLTAITIGSGHLAVRADQLPIPGKAFPGLG